MPARFSQSYIIIGNEAEAEACRDMHNQWYLLHCSNDTSIGTDSVDLNSVQLNQNTSLYITFSPTAPTHNLKFTPRRA